MNKSHSETKLLDRGCVQGSILGPRLFSLYVGELYTQLQVPGKSVDLILYADDTYVVVRSPTVSKIIDDTQEIALRHVQCLKNLGMVVNEDKTEIMWIGKARMNLQLTLFSLTMSDVTLKTALKHWEYKLR